MTDDNMLNHRTEYGGTRGDNRHLPSGQVRPLSAAERAADMRREGIREADGPYKAPEQLR